MNPEHVIGSRCAEAASLIDRIANYAGGCPKRRWRGPFCRALQVYMSFWRYKDKGEVPLDAASLGLGPRHVKYLLPVQRQFGKSASFDSLAMYYIAVLDEMQRRQVALDLARMLGAI